MLTSISPFGGRARATRWWTIAVPYTLASTAGGVVMGGLAALLGGLVPQAVRWSPWSVGVVAALLAVGVVLDGGEGGRRIPSWRRQVDEGWIGSYRGWVVGVGFGSQLGFGVVTIVTSTTTYAVVLLAALAGDVRVGVLLGGVFGLVRALPLVATARVRSRTQLWDVMRRVEHNATLAGAAARVALAAASLALTAVALTGG